MQWDKDTFREARIAAKLSQHALADNLGVHWRTVQNWEKVTTPIPTSVLLALDKLLGVNNDVVPKEEYDKVVSALTSTTEALNSATELNKKLSDILHNSLRLEPFNK